MYVVYSIHGPLLYKYEYCNDAILIPAEKLETRCKWIHSDCRRDQPTREEEATAWLAEVATATELITITIEDVVTFRVVKGRQSPPVVPVAPVVPRTHVIKPFVQF